MYLCNPQIVLHEAWTRPLHDNPPGLCCTKHGFALCLTISTVDLQKTVNCAVRKVKSMDLCKA